MSEHDEQDTAELYDEESLGQDETIIETDAPDGRIHGQLFVPDGGADDGAELAARELRTDGETSPEEAALHLEEFS